MYWIFRQVRFLLYVSAIKPNTANEQCRTEVNIQGMALKCSVFKRWSMAAPHLCDVKCGREIAYQSYNYNRKYQICELYNRTKEARPENFLSAPGWFYIRRLNSRAPLGSIPEFPAISCLEIKASERQNTISGKYWLDPTGTGKGSGDIDECSSGDYACDEDANCTDTKGSHFFTCKKGYAGAEKSCQADPCHHYSNLSEANRNTKHQTPPYGTALCDSQLHEGWLSFCRSCRNKNANNACASIQMWYRLARLVGWCSSYSRRRTVCFSDRFAGCKSSNTISVKNCGSYFIYDFGLLYAYNARYCATD